MDTCATKMNFSMTRARFLTYRSVVIAEPAQFETSLKRLMMAITLGHMCWYLGRLQAWLKNSNGCIHRSRQPMVRDTPLECRRLRVGVRVARQGTLTFWKMSKHLRVSWRATSNESRSRKVKPKLIHRVRNRPTRCTLERCNSRLVRMLQYGNVPEARADWNLAGGGGVVK